MPQVLDPSVSSEAQRNNRLAHEYLSALQELTSEINSAIGVLVINSLPEFQEHVSRQEFLTSRLQELSKDLGATNAASPIKPDAVNDSNLWNDICTARMKLAELNRRYSTFLQYSWRFIGTMTELCRTYEANVTPAALSVSGQLPLSCEV